MTYLRLFAGFMYIGLMAIGGGYAALPFLRQQCVSVYQWITMTEFADLLTLSQITPGAIAINSASFVGTKVGGVAGAVIATAGFILPPFLITSFLWFVYKKYSKMDLMQGILYGLKPTVVALIAASGISVLQIALWGEAAVSLGTLSWLSVGIILAAFLVLRRWKLSSLTIIFAAGGVGLLAQIIRGIL